MSIAIRNGQRAVPTIKERFMRARTHGVPCLPRVLCRAMLCLIFLFGMAQCTWHVHSGHVMGRVIPKKKHNEVLFFFFNFLREHA